MTGVAATRRRQKGETRERLVVDAAAATIAERGLANVRVSDIAHRAGMSAGHVTYYFPSKTALLVRAIQHSEQALHEQVAAEVLQIVDPWARLYRLITLAASTGQGDQGWVLWFEAWANAGLDEDVARAQVELDARWRNTLTDVIHYGCSQGAFATDDPEAVALLLSSLIDGLSVHVTLGDPQVDNEVLGRLVVRAAEAHLKPDGQASDRTEVRTQPG